MRDYTISTLSDENGWAMMAPPKQRKGGVAVALRKKGRGIG
ncbi:MAG: hypothetical protein OJF51_003313 [Nitrospira sp.]|nr:MAG: hypothetical protein OJF51_003313 [Nitrospira sp.]